MLRRLRWLAVLTALAACGARTGLLSQEAAPGPIVTFDAGTCHEPPWLLFDVFDQTLHGTSGIYAMRAVIAPDGTQDRTLLFGSDTSPVYGHPVFEADSQTIVYGGGDGLRSRVGSRVRRDPVTAPHPPSA